MIVGLEFSVFLSESPTKGILLAAPEALTQPLAPSLKGVPAFIGLSIDEI